MRVQRKRVGGGRVKLREREKGRESEMEDQNGRGCGRMACWKEGGGGGGREERQAIKQGR